MVAAHEKIKIPAHEVTFPLEYLADMLSDATFSIDYWCDVVSFTLAEDPRNSRIEVVIDEEMRDEGDKDGHRTINYQTIIKGIEALLRTPRGDGEPGTIISVSNWPKMWDDVMEAVTSKDSTLFDSDMIDTVIQFAIFGRLAAS